MLIYTHLVNANVFKALIGLHVHQGFVTAALPWWKPGACDLFKSLFLA
jgi:hypothetical protein